jgi:crotonobetaine/carnitine-CoA ligase
MGYPVWSADTQDTVTAVLSRAAKQFPDQIFLDFQGEKYTFSEIDEKSTRLAHGLLARNVARGDRVGSILDSNLDSVLLWFAVNKIGAIHVPINTAYKGEFLRHQFASAGCRIMVSENDYASRILDVAAELPEGELILIRGETVAANSSIATEPLQNAYADNAQSIEDKNTPSDLCMLVFTGGTTGPSKGCMISHNYACNLARQILKRENRAMGDVNWTPLPLFHMNATAGSILSCMMVGATVAVFPRFSVSKFWPDVERSGATVVNLLGSMIGFIANAAENESAKRYFGKLKAVRGAPFSQELQETWKTRFGVQYAGSNGYGLTEAARVTSLPDGVTAPPGSSGRVNEDFDVRIVDDDDNELPPGQAGEIIVRPRHPGIMFDGYWNQPEETLKVMKNLWLHSGDIGKFDEDGFFYFVDRKKDYLRRRGENISSFEMETTLKAHPLIEEVAVHAVFADSEDEVKVTATLVDGSALDEEDLCRWCVDRLPYFAVPRFIEFRTELPRSPFGRILKYQLRDQGCTPNTWDRETTDFELSKR